jgi:hypothetical protein
MHRRLTLLMTVVLLIGLMAAPAAADKPAIIGPFADGFVGTDPCTGLEHVGTLELTFYVHGGHPNNFGGRVELTGTTDSGYVMIGGSNVFQENDNVFVSSFNEIWRNPDSGAMYEASSVFRITGNDIVVDTFDLRCIGGATILP